jgi:hypothetical protein
MKNNKGYIIIVALFIVWVVGVYALNIRTSAINILIVIAVILLFYKLISGEPRQYGRRGLR